MRCEWLGLKDYIESVKLQDRTVSRASLIQLMTSSERKASEVVYGVEHPFTITLGKRSNPIDDIRVSVRELRARKVAIVGTERGGQATLHNPGQLVIYPLINLRERRLRVRDYMCLLQQVSHRMLKDLGVPLLPLDADKPGLYTEVGKIGFFGIRVKNGMSSHGLSLNVHNDLEDFQFILSCGKSNETFDRMSHYMDPPAFESLFAQWCTYFQTGLSLTQDLIRPMLVRQFDSRI